MSPYIPESEVIPASPEEIRVQLTALRDEWQDMPDAPRLTQEETEQPNVRAARRHNKRRLGPWFGPVVYWTEQAAMHISDHVEREAMKTRIDALQSRVTTLTDTPYQTTNEDVTEADALIAQAFAVLDYISAEKTELS